MSGRQFLFEFVFTGDPAGAVAAAGQVRAALATLGPETAKGTAAAQDQAAALDREAAAARTAAAATRDLAEAERQARAEFVAAAGAAQQKTAARALPGNLSGLSGASAPGSSTTAMIASSQSQAEAVRGVGAATVAAARESALYRQELDAVRAQYNPLFAASREYEAELRRVAAAEKMGAISAREAAAARQVAANRMAPAQGSRGGGGRPGELNEFDRRNLMYQQFDVVQSVALGMPLHMVAMQQGPQIVQIYGSVGAAAKALTSTLTPLRLGLGLTAGAVLAGATAWNNYLRSTKEVQIAAAGLGRAMALPAAEMDAAARAGAAAAGISVSAARGMQTEFLRTGRIGAENFEGLIGISKDFAATMGMDAGAAGDALAKMFADPAKAADELYSRYGLIDGAVARQVTNLAAQNRVSEAQAVLLDALPDRLVKATDATTAFGRAWEAVASGASNAFDWVGATIDRAIDGPSLEEQISAARERLELAQRAEQNPRRPRARANSMNAAEARAALEALEAQRDAEEAERRRAAEAARGSVALGIAQDSPANANALREEALRNRLAALQAGRNAPDIDDTQRGQIDASIEATSNALAGLTTRRDRLLQLDRLDIQIQNERNPILRAELEARRAALAMAGDEVTAAQVASEADRARTRGIGEAVAAAEAQTAQMRTESEARARVSALVSAGLVPASEANRLLQEELQLRPLVEAAAAAEGEARIRLNQVLAEQRALLDEAARARQAEGAGEYLRGRAEDLAMLELEVQLLGQSEQVRRRVLALAEAEQEIRQRGIETTSALADQMRSEAVQRAARTAELENEAEAWGRVQGAAENSIDGIVDSLLAADIGGVFEGVLKEVTGLFTDLAIKAPLKNAILGTDYATLDDVGGLQGIWGRLTGQAEAMIPTASSMGVGTMQVNAATVIINGGISGALGGVTGVMGAANLTGAPGGWTGASGQTASVLGSVAVGGGTRPDAISGLNAGFADPLAAMVADAQKIFGAEAIKITSGFRSVEVQQRLWDEALVKYGSPEAARQWVAPPGQSRHNYGLAADLGFGDPKVQDWAHQNAGRYGLDFRMQNEPWHIEPQNAAAMMSGAAPASLGEADRVLSQFASTAQSATGQLGTLGGGFDAFASGLANMLTGGNGAEGLFSTIFGAMGIPGFATGGNHTGGLRIVGERGPELEYTGPSTILPADLTRSILAAPPPPPANRAGGAGGPMRVSFNLVNNSGVPIEAEGEATVDEAGGITVDARLNRAVAQAVTQRGGPTDKALRARGAKAQTWRRS